MVLATLLLLCSFPQADDAGRAVIASNAKTDGPAVSAAASDNVSKDSSAAASLPSAPEPKVKPNVEPASLRSAAQPFQPLRPATRPRETARQRKIWYGLMAVGHTGAALDAWSTRRAISGGYGQEANPFLSPFAHSNALYAATQVSPAFMDFLGKRMMTSQNPWVRKLWWVPQAAGASVSFAAVGHNLSVVH
jgi:hypothetical protein